jgi:hypothetical protein
MPPDGGCGLGAIRFRVHYRISRYRYRYRTTLIVHTVSRGSLTSGFRRRSETRFSSGAAPGSLFRVCDDVFSLSRPESHGSRASFCGAALMVLISSSLLPSQFLARAVRRPAGLVRRSSIRGDLSAGTERVRSFVGCLWRRRGFLQM